MAFKIRFLLTSRCTATCTYCHNEGQSKQGASLLRLSSIQHVLDTLEEAHIVPEEIVLSGGEPTLHKHVGEIARRCHATGAHVSMDTHAGHPQLLQAALPYVHELKMHIDSFDAANQRHSMGIEISNVLTSIRLAQQFPALQLRVNHPMRDIQETATFIKRTRELGYTQQTVGNWLHSDGKHRVFHKRCGAEHNTHDNTLFIGADGVRRAIDGTVIGYAEQFNLNMIH